MSYIYKVTGGSIENGNDGLQTIKLVLDNYLLASKTFPSGQPHERDRELLERYAQNNNLEFLIGKYIDAVVAKVQNGYALGLIYSLDAIQEFKNRLDNCSEREFRAGVNMHEFLTRRGYALNGDGTLTLKGSYNRFNLTNKNICFRNDIPEDALALHNIDLIFEKFYKGKEVANNDPDVIEIFILNYNAISVDYRKTGKNSGKVISQREYDVLKIGDSLTREQCEYISTIRKN